MRRLFAMLTVAVLAGCANMSPSSAPLQTVPALQSDYSAAEETHMTICVGLTDNAMSIADYKLLGRSAGDVKQEYASRPLSPLTMPLIDKVYGDTFSNSWDYSVSFFKECAFNMAAIPEARAGLASYCAQHAMVASVAKKYKDSNVEIEKAYQRFAAFQTAWPRKVVENVYSQSGSGPEIVTSTWHSCMAPITGG